MATNRAKRSKRSTKPTTAEDFPGQVPRAQTALPRAYRDDTPEAREQQRRAPKTHPRRTIGARRKDLAEKPKSLVSGRKRQGA